MKKFLIGLFIVLAAAVGAVCTLDIGTGFIAQKGAEYVANTYNMGVAMGEVSGNPVRGYTIKDLELTRDGKWLLKAGKIAVDPALMKIITGTIALDWVELNELRTSVSKLEQLAGIVTGQKVTLPDGLPQGELTLKSVGGTLDGDAVEAAIDVDAAGLPIKGSFSVTIKPGVDVKKAVINVAGGEISASGAVTPSLNLKVSASKVQVADLAPLVPALKSQSVKGLVNADFTVTGEPANPVVKGSVKFDDGSALGFPIAAATTVDMADMKVNLKPLTVSAIGIPTSGSVFADLSGKTPSVKVNIATDGAVKAETLKKNLPSLPADLSGQVDHVSVALEGPVTGLKGTVELKADNLSAGGQSVTGTLFSAAFDAKGLVTLSGGSNIAGNPASLKGTVNMGGKEMAADVVLSVKNFDLASLPKLVASAPANLKGKVNVALTVKGTGDKIAAGGKIDSAKISMDNMSVEKISIPVAYSGSTVTIKDAGAIFMNIPITNINGSITMGDDNVAVKELTASAVGAAAKIDSVVKFGKNLEGTFDINVNGLDMTKLMNTFGAASLKASGKVDGVFKGAMAGTEITGAGSLSSAAISMTGLKFEQIKSSINLNKMVLTMPDISAKFADGSIKGDASVDINKMTYAVKADLAGSKLENIIKQMMPTLGGGLSGVLTGDYSASGTLSPFKLDGSGTVTSAGGQVYGFSIVDLVAKLHGGKALTYANAKVPFTMDADKLTLKDGTVINAPQNDGMYKYLKATGTMTFAGALNFNVNGNVNAMLINTIMAGASGGVKAGGAASLLTGVVGGAAGALTGAVAGAGSAFGVNDFRDISLHVGGTTSSPSISNFKMDGAEVKTDAKSDAKTTDKAAGKTTEKAPAKNTGKQSVEDQIKKELGSQLNNLFKK